MAEWIKRKVIPFDFTFEEQVLNPEVIQEIVDMIHPPVYTPTLLGRLGRFLRNVPYAKEDFHISAVTEGRPDFRLLRDRFWTGNPI